MTIVDGEKLVEAVAQALEETEVYYGGAEIIRSFLPRLSEFAPEAGEDVQNTVDFLNWFSKTQLFGTHTNDRFQEIAVLLFSQSSKIAALEDVIFRIKHRICSNPEGDSSCNCCAHHWHYIDAASAEGGKP